MNKSTEPVTFEETQKILDQMKKCICKINAREIYGTGFFCKLRYLDNTSYNVLTTSYSLIDEDYLKENNEINLLLNNGDTRVIYLDNKRKIYSSKEYDLTLIQLRKKDNILNYFEIDENLLSQENPKAFFENKSIYTIHYLNMEKVSVSYGFLTELNESEMKHTCIIKSGSYGSPILNSLNNKIIGISKEQNNTLDSGTFLKLPIIEFNNQNNQTSIPNKSSNVNNLSENDNNINNINNINNNTKTNNLLSSRNKILYNTNLTTEKPKMMIVFKTVKVSYGMVVDYGTTIEDLIKKFLKKVKGKTYFDVKKIQTGFLFNSVRLNKNEKLLKSVVEKYFKNRRLPTIIVAHL